MPQIPEGFRIQSTIVLVSMGLPVSAGFETRPKTKECFRYINDSRPTHPGARFLLTAACVIVIVAGLKAAAEVVRPFILATFMGVISLPLLVWLRNRGLPKGLAVGVTLLAVIAVVSGLVALVGGSLNSFVDEVPKYQERLGEMIAVGQQQLEKFGLERIELVDVVDPGQLVDVVRSTVAGVAGVVSKGLLVLLTLIFILLEATGFYDKLRLAFGLDLDTRGLSRALKEIQNYLAIKTAISLLTGLLIWAWVFLLGIDFPVLWGLLAFLLNYIPNLGSIIAAVPAVLLAIIQQGPGTGLLTALGFLSVNFVLGNLVEPNLMGRRLGLSALVVFVSLVFWGWVWGPVGMLLSVPLTMVLKILLENIEDFRWLAVLLGPNPTPRS